MDELLALLDKTDQATYHARYKLSSPAAASRSTDVTLETWRQGASLREDQTASQGGTTAVIRSIKTPSGIVVCQNAENTAWSCRNGQAGTVAGSTDVDALRQHLQGADVTVHSDTIVGVPVRCFTIALATAQGPSTDVCLTADGVPARSASGDEKVELQTLDQVVPDGTFTPPANPT
jgi:hypothetical protein